MFFLFEGGSKKLNNVHRSVHPIEQRLTVHSERRFDICADVKRAELRFHFSPVAAASPISLPLQTG